MLAAENGGTDADLALERACEMTLIREAGIECDFGQRQQGVAQTLTCTAPQTA